MDAIRILLNLLFFCVVLFSTTLLIEKFYAGRLKWAVSGLLLAFLAFFALRPDFLVSIMEAVTGGFSLERVALIAAGGVCCGLVSSGV